MLAAKSKDAASMYRARFATRGAAAEYEGSGWKALTEGAYQRAATWLSHGLSSRGGGAGAGGAYGVGGGGRAEARVVI